MGNLFSIIRGKASNALDGSRNPRATGLAPGVSAATQDFCRSVIIDIAANRDARQALLSSVNEADVQLVIDYVSQLLDDSDQISENGRKYLLHFLAKLVKTKQLFPQRLRLKGMRFDPSSKMVEAWGGSGLIYKTKYKGETVCVKILRYYGDANKEKFRAFAGEIILLAHVSHPNIVRLHGIYDSQEEVSRICLVSPWFENGDLRRYLIKFPESPRVPLAHDIICGLEHLHGVSIVHGDLKGVNVLVSKHGRAMLTDFGLSRIHKMGPTTTLNNGGTGNWMAPELVPTGTDAQTLTSTPMSDIWAFGCTCYEVLTGESPFPNLDPGQALLAAARGAVPRKPEQADQWSATDGSLWRLAESCWARRPNDRPNACQLQIRIAKLNTSDSRMVEPDPMAKTKTAIDHWKFQPASNSARLVPCPSSESLLGSSAQVSAPRGPSAATSGPNAKPRVTAPTESIPPPTGSNSSSPAPEAPGSPPDHVAPQHAVSSSTIQQPTTGKIQNLGASFPGNELEQSPVQIVNYGLSTNRTSNSSQLEATPPSIKALTSIDQLKGKDVVILSGKSGAGKSTFINDIYRLDVAKNTESTMLSDTSATYVIPPLLGPSPHYHDIRNIFLVDTSGLSGSGQADHRDLLAASWVNIFKPSPENDRSNNPLLQMVKGFLYFIDISDETGLDIDSQTNLLFFKNLVGADPGVLRSVIFVTTKWSQRGEFKRRGQERQFTEWGTELQRLFPGSPVVRLDAETSRADPEMLDESLEENQTPEAEEWITRQKANYTNNAFAVLKRIVTTPATAPTQLEREICAVDGSEMNFKDISICRVTADEEAKIENFLRRAGQSDRADEVRSSREHFENTKVKDAGNYAEARKLRKQEERRLREERECRQREERERKELEEQRNNPPPSTIPLENIRQLGGKDVVMLFGKTRVGKSTFINDAYRSKVVASTGSMVSGTNVISFVTSPLSVPRPWGNTDLYLVDTIGLSRSGEDHDRTLLSIKWVNFFAGANRGGNLAPTVKGFLYFIDISDPASLNEDDRTNLNFFQGLVGNSPGVLQSVIFVTAKWAQNGSDQREDQEERFEEWNSALKDQLPGSAVVRLDGETSRASRRKLDESHPANQHPKAKMKIAQEKEKYASNAFTVLSHVAATPASEVTQLEREIHSGEGEEKTLAEISICRQIAEETKKKEDSLCQAGQGDFAEIIKSSREKFVNTKVQDVRNYVRSVEQVRADSRLANERGELVAAILKSTSKANSLVNLQGMVAQTMADFLTEVLENQEFLQSDAERRHILHLLRKILRFAQVFPKRSQLHGVECNLADPISDIGGYGSIYKGNLEGQTVCVKAVRVGARFNSAMRAQTGELALLTHVSHSNVIPLYGAYLSEEPNPRICIVSPWIENGDLVSYLRKFPDTPRIPLMSDVAAGLMFLHDMGIVHGDLKARNVLVSRSQRAMLADFAVSTVFNTGLGTSTIGDIAGTTYWMAPERLLAEEVSLPTPESDMWGFGCTCFEAMTGQTPFADHYKSLRQLIQAFVRANATPLQPKQNSAPIIVDGASGPLVTLAERCWNYEPSERPTAAEALQSLTELYVEDNRPAMDEELAMFEAVKSKRPEVKIDYRYLLSVVRKN